MKAGLVYPRRHPAKLPGSQKAHGLWHPWALRTSQRQLLLGPCMSSKRSGTALSCRRVAQLLLRGAAAPS